MSLGDETLARSSAVWLLASFSSSSSSSIGTSEAGKKQSEPVTARTPTNFTPALWQWRTRRFQHGFENSPGQKGLVPAPGEVRTDVRRDETEGKQMAEGELQPGSLGQALGLKIQPELFCLCVSLGKLGKGKEEGGERREGNRGRENFMLQLFTEVFI